MSNLLKRQGLRILGLLFLLSFLFPIGSAFSAIQFEFASNDYGNDFNLILNNFKSSHSLTGKYIIFKGTTYNITTPEKVSRITYYYFDLSEDTVLTLNQSEHKLYFSGSYSAFWNSHSIKSSGENESWDYGDTLDSKFNPSNPFTVYSPKELPIVSENNSFYYIYDTNVPVYDSETGQNIITNYSLSLDRNPPIYYKNENVKMINEGYERVDILVNSEYVNSIIAEGTAVAVPYDIWKNYESDNFTLWIKAYKKMTDEIPIIFSWDVQIKKNEINPDSLGDGEDSTDGSWFDGIEQPIPPDNSWDLIGWIKYLVEWILYLVKIVIATLASLGSSIAELFGQFGGLMDVLKSFFSFLPVPIITVMSFGLTISVILRVFKR